MRAEEEELEEDEEEERVEEVKGAGGGNLWTHLVSGAETKGSFPW